VADLDIPLIAQLERTLKDADNALAIRGPSGQKSYDDIAATARDQITATLMRLRQIKDKYYDTTK
jgi:hypothetical protein